MGSIPQSTHGLVDLCNPFYASITLSDGQTGAKK